MTAAPCLTLHPQQALVDEELSISVSGLSPYQSALLRASFHDDHQMRWVSWALFEADEAGKIDLCNKEPLEGTYRGIDPMGLIWSMEPEEANASAFRPSRADLVLTVQLEIDGQIVETQTALRKKGDSTVTRIEVREEGLVATLFLPPQAKQCPAVMILSGSGGGLSEGRAHLLASHGYVTLALAYFGMPALPQGLEKIPLEYFEKALQFLSQHPAVDGERIGIWGISRGGELSLLLGTLFPERMKAICAYVPSSVVWGGFPNDKEPAWLLRQENALPPAPFATLRFAPSDGSNEAHAIETSRFFHEALRDRNSYAASEIPVEKITCPILLVSGEDDQMWPSAWFGRQIEERLRKMAAAPATHLCYPKAGHLFSTPYFPTTRSRERHPVAKLWFSFGGTPKEEAAARKDAWQKTVAFFQKTLRGRFE